MTYVRYGSYRHELAECTVTRSVSPRLSQLQQVIGYTLRWDIGGEIIADGAVAIALRLGEIDAAYSVQGQDLTLETEGGIVLLALRSAGSISGVRVYPPNLPDAGSGAWATGLKFNITAEAEYGTEFPGGEAALTSWQETLVFSGGGPRFVWLQPLEGNPIKQRVANSTPFRLDQSGSGVGRYRYPPIPPPLYPQHLWENPRVTRTGPTPRGGQLLDYGVSWTYVHEAIGPFDGYPTLPPF